MNAALPRHLDAYYKTLRGLRQHNAEWEGATRAAFQQLLSEVARPRGYTVIGEKTVSLPGGRRLRFDGEVRDAYFSLGIWEAKDTADDLEKEIRKKLGQGYPTKNTIFEDTRRGVLFQHGTRVLDVDLAQPAELQRLLDQFFAYSEPQIDQFHEAVGEFKRQIPALAASLSDIIAQERRENPRFVQALESFWELCRSALNPATTLEAVEDMLKQHLLTERIFRSVFNNPDFVQRNAIARELERVVAALTSRSFSRTEFLGRLDYFYHAIEAAARTIRDYSEKQSFLHAVYEQFFQAYSTDTADTHGIVYTPAPIVRWMVASVEQALQREFGLSLSEKGVHLLDPCVGTGTFMLEILAKLSPSALPHKYAHELHCNEILLLPYYIAAQNIEHEYFERTGGYAPFEGICFADTLDMGHTQMNMFAQENTARIQRQEESPIFVIIGNPPYNVGQANENDNNKNRAYPDLDRRIRSTYVKSSSATLNTKLYDMYVRFFRWATDRLGTRDGVICFISNNGFLRGIAFDGFRKELLAHFTRIYHFDFRGNARTSGELRKQEGGNIFNDQIRAGVGITLLIRKTEHLDRQVFYHSVGNGWSAEQKQKYLSGFSALTDVPWEVISPDARGTWLREGISDDFDAFLPMGSKEAKSKATGAEETIFTTYSLGVATNRDAHVYEFSHDDLASRARTFVEIYNNTVDIARRKNQCTDAEALIGEEDPRIKWTRQTKKTLLQHKYAEFTLDHLRQCLYRPFTRKFVYFDDFWNEERYQQHTFFPIPITEQENTAICLTHLGSEKPFMALATMIIPDLHLVGAGAGTQCFPFYTYDEDGSNRRENITDWALEQWRAAYGPDVTKWDIFHAIYGLLHAPWYRERYAANLKRDLPRIPLVAPEDYAAYRDAGRRLAELHTTYERAPEYRLPHDERRDTPWTWRVEKMRLSKDRTQLIYNEVLTLQDIPAEAFDYRLGNRSALEWVIDQYQVKTDKRSGITSDPNDPADQERIVRLIKQVVWVSVETVKIVRGLPGAGAGEPSPNG